MPTTRLAALIKRLRGIWGRYRLRAEAAQNRRDDGHGRGYAWGQVTKETQTAQGHRRSTKEIRASVRIAGSRWRQSRAQGLQTSAKAVSPLRFGHRAHKVGYGKVGKAMRQGMIQKIYC